MNALKVIIGLLFAIVCEISLFGMSMSEKEEDKLGTVLFLLMDCFAIFLIYYFL